MKINGNIYIYIYIYTGYRLCFLNLELYIYIYIYIYIYSKLRKHKRYPVLISHQPKVMPQFRWLRWYCHPWRHQQLLPSDREWREREFTLVKCVCFQMCS